MPNPPSPTITSTSNSNLVNPKYEAAYMSTIYKRQIYGQYVDWLDAVSPNGGPQSGTSWDIPVIGEMDDVTTELVETQDVTVKDINDYNVTLSLKEYGNAAVRTKKFGYHSRVAVDPMMAEIMGANQANSIDRILRDQMLGGTQVYMPNGNTTRTGLDATNDLITYDALLELKATTEIYGMEPRGGNTHTIVVPPMFMRDLLAIPEAKNIAYYQDKQQILNGYVGTLAGFDFVVARHSKVYLSGGTQPQAPTTTTGTSSANGTALSVGGTQVTVASATGLSVGDVITIDTLESATAEQVVITAVSTNTLTIRGLGKGVTGSSLNGFRFAHANGVAVTEGANVAALLIVGKGGVIGKYGSDVGPTGVPLISSDVKLHIIPQRFIYYGWYWYGGLTVVNRNVLRAEFAMRGAQLGMN